VQHRLSTGAIHQVCERFCKQSLISSHSFCITAGSSLSAISTTFRDNTKTLFVFTTNPENFEIRGGLISNNDPTDGPVVALADGLVGGAVLIKDTQFGLNGRNSSRTIHFLEIPQPNKSAVLIFPFLEPLIRISNANSVTLSNFSLPNPLAIFRTAEFELYFPTAALGNSNSLMVISDVVIPATILVGQMITTISGNSNLKAFTIAPSSTTIAAIIQSVGNLTIGNILRGNQSNPLGEFPPPQFTISGPITLRGMVVSPTFFGLFGQW